jgi:predicted transcriptional regulator
MEVHFTPEQETQLSQIATHAGTDAERLVKDAALRLLQEEARFRAAVREGIAQADRGEFIEEEEMDGRPPRADAALVEVRIRRTSVATAGFERMVRFGGPCGIAGEQPVRLKPDFKSLS